MKSWRTGQNHFASREGYVNIDDVVCTPGLILIYKILNFIFHSMEWDFESESSIQASLLILLVNEISSLLVAFCMPVWALVST